LPYFGGGERRECNVRLVPGNCWGDRPLWGGGGLGWEYWKTEGYERKDEEWVKKKKHNT